MNVSYFLQGHAADDPVLPSALPFTSQIADSADVNGDGIVTNWEFYVALDPNKIEVCDVLLLIFMLKLTNFAYVLWCVQGNDYVFDNFEWSHCTEGTIDTSSTIGQQSKLLSV